MHRTGHAKPTTPVPSAWHAATVPGPAELAIACCRATRDGDPGDLFPDPDSELLRGALLDLGVRSQLVSWDDPAVDWSRRPVTAIRSTWDSVDRPEEYLAWARAVDRHSTLLNPAAVVEWNLDKTYLLDLAAAGVTIVPTTWVRAGDSWAPPPGEYVVKPSISAGGRETARYGADHGEAALAHVTRLLAAGQTVMVQPYVPSVVSPGELSLVFVGGRCTHAVRKGAVLEVGAGVRERPWERMTFLGLSEPTTSQAAVAEATLALVHQRFGQTLTYARVDLIDGLGDEPQVLEVELIDPNLSLSLVPAATTALATALAARL